MAFQYQPLELKDFTGGFTDNYINADPKLGQVVKNLFVLPNKTLRTRFGTLIDNDIDPQIPEGTNRINALINYNYDDFLLRYSGQNIYFRDKISFLQTPILGPATAAPFPILAAASPFLLSNYQTNISHTQWNKHLMICTDSFDKPIKIYKDSTGVLQARTAGLPFMATDPVVGETLPAAFAATSVSDTTDEITKVAHGIITGQKVQLTTTGTFPDPFVGNLFYYAVVIDADNFKLSASLAEALSNVTLDILTVGTGTLTITPVAGDGAYLYAFIYKYSYTAGNEIFVDLGPRTLVQATNINSPDVVPVNITAIPTLLNAVGDNYDVNNITVQIYRTVDTGQEFYLVAEIPNGQTTYTDTMSDETLQSQEPIYTSGGIPDNEAPPVAQFCHSVNGYTYYGNIKNSDGSFDPTLLFQSQELDPDSVPGSFNDRLEDDITGISSYKDIPIVACRKHVYRINGDFDEVGRGGMTHRRLSDSAGCISHESMVETELGLFWWGNDGIYYTDGYICLKVTEHFNNSYKIFVETLVNKTRKLKGFFDPKTKSIYWTFSQNIKTLGSEECDSIMVMDLNWGVTQNTPCQIWEGSPVWIPTALALFNKIPHKADTLGYVVQFLENVGVDPKIIPGTPSTTWFQDTIIYHFKTITTNFGSSHSRKMANKILLDCISKTNVSIQINAINDEGKVIRPLTPIRYRKNFTWGDEEFVWGDPVFIWYYGGVISLDKRMPAKNLRFNFLQIEVTNAYTNIINSDLDGLATIDPILNTATLVNFPTSQWPLEPLDYFLYLEQDNFTYAYKVIDRPSDSVITISNPLGSLIVGPDQKWQLKGYKKAEILNLLEMSISWTFTSRSYDTFNEADTGDLT